MRIIRVLKYSFQPVKVLKACNTQSPIWEEDDNDFKSKSNTIFIEIWEYLKSTSPQKCYSSWKSLHICCMINLWLNHLIDNKSFSFK